MFKTVWLVLLRNPLENALAAVLGVIPGGDAGVAIIVLTLLVKVVLSPFSRRSIISQIKLRSLEPKLAKIKEEHPDKVAQSQQTMELYKKEGINPLSGCLLTLLQIPIILALYSLFRFGVVIHPETLYSFVSMPETISNTFLGLFDLSSKSVFLALLVGVTQFVQVRLSMPKGSPAPSGSGFQADLARGMQMQMRYVLPVMMAFFSYIGTGVIALYFLTSNLFVIAQEWSIRRKLEA